MKHIVALGDFHCGHLGGLTPPTWQSKKCTPHAKLQNEMWGHYQQFLKEFSKPDLLIVNGDAIEGTGERTGGVELSTTDREEQCQMALQCIKPWRAKSIIIVYGTRYHVSSEGEDWEKVLVGLLGTGKNVYLHGHAFPKVEGVVFDIKHHVGTSNIPHGRHTAVAKDHLWNQLWNEEGLQPKADIILRSHVHYHQFCGGVDWVAMTLPALATWSLYGARRCIGVVHWGIVTFKIDNKTWEWQSHIIKLRNFLEKTINI